MDIKYAWVDSFSSTEEQFLRKQIESHLANENPCPCGELKVVVSGDFVQQKYKARIACRCNTIDREVRGVFR